MTFLGQGCLLTAFVASGYAAFACMAGERRRHPLLLRSGLFAAWASVAGLNAVCGILIWAMLVKDFRFAYVAQYSSRLLPWYYSLSAFWVGQSGSLLLWAWFLGLLALTYRFWPRRDASPLRETAFALLMAYFCFLIAVMAFGADPMEPSLTVPQEGEGLSPSLQHPAMLIHPPIIFLGYAGWAIPFALAAAALLAKRLDANWVREVRGWALFAWTVLGIGILIGADWAYEELGWGGYWAWDPVENGSLLPWLTGTAFIHTAMAWRRSGAFKKTTLLLGAATFALCNFATFLTRSGIFSSLHAFSQSSLGWLFLILIVGVGLATGLLMLNRRHDLRPDRPIASLSSRESVIGLATVALLLLATVTLLGTVSIPISEHLLHKKVVFGVEFYNRVLLPTGMVLLAATALAPLLRWGAAPSGRQRRILLLSVIAAGLAGMVSWTAGLRQPIVLMVVTLTVLAIGATLGAWILDSFRRVASSRSWAPATALRNGRRRYGAYLIHLGLMSLAVGVSGSLLTPSQEKATLTIGEPQVLQDRTVCLKSIERRELPDRSVVEAELEVTDAASNRCTLRPSQHLYRLQKEWAAKVDIHATWSQDLYAILHGGEGDRRASVTLIVNPLMRFLWLSGWIALAGAVVGLLPAPRRAPRISSSVIPAPKFAPRRGRLVATAGMNSRHD
jgi:cytochrome c-type biogenesis protein CcmF